MLAALPSDLRAQVDRTAACFHLDVPAWYRDAERPACLADLAEAVWRQRGIAFDYLRWTEPREVARTVAPYGIVLKAGRWYLVAAGAKDIRTYRVARIQSLRVLDEHFERPAGFDLAAYWQGCLADFDARRRHGEATVLVTPTLFRLLPFLTEPAVAEAPVVPRLLTARTVACGSWCRWNRSNRPHRNFCASARRPKSSNRPSSVPASQKHCGA